MTTAQRLRAAAVSRGVVCGASGQSALGRTAEQGNVIFGMGPALFEEMIVDSGQIVNANLSDYIIPSFLDVACRVEQRLAGIGRRRISRHRRDDAAASSPGDR